MAAKQPSLKINEPSFSRKRPTSESPQRPNKKIKNVAKVPDGGDAPSLRDEPFVDLVDLAGLDQLAGGSGGRLRDLPPPTVESSMLLLKGSFPLTNDLVVADIQPYWFKAAKYLVKMTISEDNKDKRIQELTMKLNSLSVNHALVHETYISTPTERNKEVALLKSKLSSAMSNNFNLTQLLMRRKSELTCSKAEAALLQTENAQVEGRAAKSEEKAVEVGVAVESLRGDLERARARWKSIAMDAAI